MEFPLANGRPYSVHPFSTVSMPLTLSREEQQARGTGFLYLYKKKHYFVTAWHNLTGRDFITKKTISNTGWYPRTIKTALPLEQKNEGSGSIGFLRFTSRLYSDDDETQASWLVDGLQGSKIDIAVIPVRSFVDLVDDQTDAALLKEIADKLDGSSEFTTVTFDEKPARPLGHSKPSFTDTLQVSQDVFILGYPEAIGAEGAPAIWKRGTVASEPGFPLNSRTCFLIDSATRPGLSGSPVVAKFERPSWEFRGGTLSRDGTELGFCGLYSARLTGPIEQAQLGVVWPIHAIEGVIENGRIGKPAADFSGLCEEGLGESIV